MPDATPLPDFEAQTAQLKVLSHSSRMKIVNFLRKPGSRASVTEIYKGLDLPQAIASQHLIVLKDRGLLKSEKEGTKVFYSVAQPWAVAVLDVLKKQAV